MVLGSFDEYRVYALDVVLYFDRRRASNQRQQKQRQK